MWELKGVLWFAKYSVNFKKIQMDLSLRSENDWVSFWEEVGRQVMWLLIILGSGREFVDWMF